MTDRRRHPRMRSYLGARIVFNNRFSTMDCLVRDLSPGGAKIALASSLCIPGQFDLEITKRGTLTEAQVVWRSETEVGLAFARPAGADIISFDWQRRKRSETEQS